MKSYCLFAALLLCTLVAAAFTEASSSSFFRSKQVQEKNVHDPNNLFLHIGAPAPATLETSSNFFNKLTADVIPDINALARSLVIPAGGSEKEHFTYKDIRFSSFDLGPINFIFNSPNEVEVSMTELKFSIPSTGFELYDRIIFELHCSGHFDVSASLSASFKMNLVDNNGKLNIAGATDVSIDYKSFDPHVEFDHFLCKLGSDIIGLFTGGISNLIKKLVEKDLAPGIQKALTGALEKAFDKLPVELTGNPQCVNGALQIPIDLDSLLKSTFQLPFVSSGSNRRHQRNLRAPPRPLSSSSSKMMMNNLLLKAFSDRDIGLILPQASANTLFQTLKSIHKLGPFNTTEEKITTDLFKLLLPNAYYACESCPLNFRVDFVNAPTAIFSNNNATIDIQNLTLDVHAVNTSTQQFVPLFTLGLAIDLSVDNFNITGNGDNTIHFDLGLQQLQFSQVSSSVGTLPVSTLNLIASIIQSVLIPDFNKYNKGLDLNDLVKNYNISITDVEVDLTSSGFLKAGLDVNIKS